MKRIAPRTSVREEGSWVLVSGDYRVRIEASRSRKKSEGGIWIGFLGNPPPFPESKALDWIEEVLMRIRGHAK